MNEHWKFLTDFLAEGMEKAEEGADKAAAGGVKSADEAVKGPGEKTGNLEPVDAAKVAATQKSATPAVPNVKLSGVKVPGGIAAILMFILFIVFAIQPTASGQTRLQLIWAVIARGGLMRGQDAAAIDNQTPGSGASPGLPFLPGIPDNSMPGYGGGGYFDEGGHWHPYDESI